ncbi:MAG TPA: hypothetical protein VFN21_08535 [Acidimicrobiales bacterium]|nr:hypothetical protein [Acidimicrobiales bacterium]
MLVIGVIGDFRPEAETHRATTAALHHAADVLGAECDVRWIGTDEIDRNSTGADPLDGCDGLVVAPGSPYASMDGALAAISRARVDGIPLLGTCGGFQHVVLEFARNELGIVDAAHAEYDPYASELFITPLSCSLAGQSFEVTIASPSVAADAYGSTKVTERYYCNFGLNPAHLPLLVEGGLRVSGTDQDGEPRILELPDHPFFVATLFVPQTSSRPGAPHPLVRAFVERSCR